MTTRWCDGKDDDDDDDDKLKLKFIYILTFYLVKCASFYFYEINLSKK